MTIVVMAKPPVAGRAKTRLIPALGAEGAARLHAALARHAMATAVSAATQLGTLAVLATADAPTHPFYDEVVRRHNLQTCPQGDGNLGVRMQRVFGEYLPQGPVVMIGCDCPTLTVQDLVATYDALSTIAATFIAAEDGGYVLIGLARDCPALFQKIDWGTERVLAQTLTQANASGIRTKVLATRYDIDREPDYQRMCREQALPGWP